MRKDAVLRTLKRKAVVDIGLFSLVINLLLLVMPIYMLQIYDRVLPSARLETLLYLSLIAVGALAFLGALDAIRAIYAQRIATSLDRDFGSLAFASVLDPKRSETSDIQPLRDLATIRNFIGSRGLANLFDLPFAPFFVALLYFVHPLLFTLTLAGAAFLVAVVLLNQAAARQSSSMATSGAAAANFSAQAFARNIDSLRAMGMRDHAVEFWGQRFAEGLHHQERAATINAAFSGLSRAARMLLQLAILGVGAWLVLQNEMTAGMIFASSIISGRALQPLDQLIGGWRQVDEARKAWNRLKEVFQEPAHKTAEPIELPPVKGAVTAQDLIYRTPDAGPTAEPVLKRVSFAVKAGESLAVIGPSRSGKTTLARLLVGAAAPTGGNIRVDGADIRTWRESQLGRSIGYLPQDVQLFPGTIAQNIARFEPDPDDDRIVAAAQHAHAHELILAQPAGYQTQIDLSGRVLSGGERQRIGLARAFYGAPKILILDEPNSNLDSDGHDALSRALAEARQAGSTIILITHRIQLAAECDSIMVLKSGLIDDLGPAREVLQRLVPARPPGAHQPGQMRIAPTDLASRPDRQFSQTDTAGRS